MVTTPRDAAQLDIEAQIAAYLDLLKPWPVETVQRVILAWPRRDAPNAKWWPSWAELQAELPDVRPARLPPPEHRPAPSRSQEQAGMHALFTHKGDWDGFAAAMASLRDPNVPYIAREHLLRIGEAIEARQRPNAERMGWV